MRVTERQCEIVTITWLLFFPFLLILRSFYCVNYNQHPFYICEQFLFFLLLRGTEKAGFVFFLVCVLGGGIQNML